MAEIQNELQKEFELERMILFSDAVFAIAITLLILEVKFPHLPDNPTVHETQELFKPVIIRFTAFAISFFFIGVMWAKHLKMFKYLRSYNGTIITLNLIFLFFIVCFPFILSGFSENTHTHFSLPIFLYISNLALVSTAKGVLAFYIFRKDSKNTVPGFLIEKKYLLLESVWTASAFITILLIMIVINQVYPGKPAYMIFAIYALPVMMIIMKRKLKKFKPVKIKN
jgi:uncharacterized membrane protein